MAVVLNDLSRTDLQVLTELCDKSGKDLSAALREAVEAYLVAVPNPAEEQGPRKSTQERKAAFRRAAGAWQDVDTDAMIEDLYALRSRPSRPVPEW